MKCKMCNKKAIPGKVYCNSHIHGKDVKKGNDKGIRSYKKYSKIKN